MKGILSFIILIFLAAPLFGETNDPMASGPVSQNKDASQPPRNSYSQLFGIKGGGAFFIESQKAGGTLGVFFENVFTQDWGIEIKVMHTEYPITNYGTTYTGVGLKDYIELGAGLKFYLAQFAIFTGFTYNDYLSGYILYNNYTNYYQILDTGENFLGVYFGFELSAQVSADLFSKVGLELSYGFFNMSTFCTRFYISFAYGL